MNNNSMDTELATQKTVVLISAEQFFTKENYDALIQYCRHSFRICIEEAEDTVHSTIEKVLRVNTDVKKTEGEWRGYIFTALRNTYLNSSRKRTNHREVNLDEETINQTGDSWLDEPRQIVEESMRIHMENQAREREEDALAPLAQRLENVLEFLTNEDQELLKHWRAGFSNEEIAMELNIPVESVKYRKDLLKRKVRYHDRASGNAASSARARSGTQAGDTVPAISLFRTTGFPNSNPPGGHMNRSRDKLKTNFSDGCTEPLLEHLVQLYGYDFLLETLQLQDDLFEAIYREAMPELERTLLYHRLLQHHTVCVSCQTLAEQVEDELAVIECRLLIPGTTLVLGFCLIFAAILTLMMSPSTVPAFL